jgi:N-acetylglucosaminyldiphosphoundecaprenol N-acetyl-beta-D-mannosaminyltransferase
LERESCVGVPLAVTSPAEAVFSILSASGDNGGRAIHFCNAYTLSLAHSDQDYREMLCTAAICFADGQSVVWARHLFSRGSSLKKVSGPDLFEAVFAASTQRGPRHYLLGGDEPTLDRLQRRLRSRFPEAQIVGRESPPFRPLTDREIRAQDARIAESTAEIVWVGLGTPKQDYEVRRLANSLPVTAIAVGAAFDFTAGTKKRAPAWMRSVGLEWVHRLASEPRRLWKRYLVGNAVFLWAAWKWRREN